MDRLGTSIRWCGIPDEGHARSVRRADDQRSDASLRLTSFMSVNQSK